MPPQFPEVVKKGLKTKSLVKYALHAAVLIGIGVAAVKYVDGQELQKALYQFSWIFAPFVCLLGLASLVAKAWRFASMVQLVAPASRHMLMKAYIAGQSATLVPGGIAARAAMLNEVGIEPEKTAPAITLSSLSDQLGFILLTLICAGWFEEARRPLWIVLGVVAVLSLVLGIEASRTWLLNAVQWILGKFKLQDAWKGFLKNMEETLSWKLLASSTVNTMIAFALQILALYLCVRGVGADIAIMPLILAFALPTMLGRISALPGGVGLTEVGMVGIINHVPNISLNQATAAVLVFRVGTVVFTALVGGLVYLFSWRNTVSRVEHQPEAAVQQ